MASIHQEGVPHTLTDPLPVPGSEAEKEAFRQLQARFPAQFETSFPDVMAPKTVIIVPSLSLDPEILETIEGIVYYEERLLCQLLLLRMPRTNVIYVSSIPIDPVIIDYYLHLLPGITPFHARQRLTLLSCYDGSSQALSAKILERPRLIERIRQSIPAGNLAHLSCFNVTGLERTLAVRLGVPVYGADPELSIWGSKSKARELFRSCGLNIPAGSENLRHRRDIADALGRLKASEPALGKAVLKLNEGFSGDGNAIYHYGAGRPESLSEIMKSLANRISPVAGRLTPGQFLEKFEQMGGVVEAFLDGRNKRSPSVQCRINPLGRFEIISTHDQELDGSWGQVFRGAFFPAGTGYASEIARLCEPVMEQLRREGVIGRFGIDFISLPENVGWKHYAIEINLRKGGTTHPYLMLQYLTNGSYQADSGIYLSASHQPRYYYATDNLKHESYKGMTPQDLMDIAMNNQLLYDGARQEGVMFHLIGALSQFGKLGLVCIGGSPARARHFYNRTVMILDQECGA